MSASVWPVGATLLQLKAHHRRLSRWHVSSITACVPIHHSCGSAAEVCWWFAATSEQFRVRGELELVTDASAWQQEDVSDLMADAHAAATARDAGRTRTGLTTMAKTILALAAAVSALVSATKAPKASKASLACVFQYETLAQTAPQMNQRQHLAQLNSSGYQPSVLPTQMSSGWWSAGPQSQ